MRLLLDTMAVIHVVQNPAALPQRARGAIEDGANDLFISIASPLEMQIKVNLGKLTLGKPVIETISIELARLDAQLLPITLEHIDALSRLPAIHGDPFDRLLIAKAIHENLTIVTGDDKIAQYPVQTIWR